MNKQRDIWIDNTKILACILVVFGHFFQSMVKANILPNNLLYQWFNTTIYYFHVPLFFICSGYLYQKYGKSQNIRQWFKNIFKKLIVLGIPYFIFSFATWILKKIFSSSVNTQIGSLPHILFFEPASPYWYLYVLFFLFLITPLLKKSSLLLSLLLLSFLLKFLTIIGIFTNIYAINKCSENWIWFIFGMIIAEKILPLLNPNKAYILLVTFLICSIIIQKEKIQILGQSFILGILACYSIISIIFYLFKDNNQNKHLAFLSKYTMPIFLMHTLFAAPLRSFLFKLGIRNSVVHILFGLIISFVGPIITMNLLTIFKPMDFIVYPGKYLKFKKE